MAEYSPQQLYWIMREQRAREREARENRQAAETALEIGELIQFTLDRINSALAPLIDEAAAIDSTESRLIWSNAPWTNSERLAYLKKQNAEFLESLKRGIEGHQDVTSAAKSAKAATRRRQINHATAMRGILEELAAELAQNEESAMRTSLAESAGRVARSVERELRAEAEAKAKADAKKSPKGFKESRIDAGSYDDSANFETPNPDQIKSIVNTSWDGADFSDRIWANKDRLLKELKATLKSAIINGDGSEKTARAFAQKMGVHFNYALRLIRTETNRVLNQTALDQMKTAGVKFYRFLAIIDSRTSEVCAGLNGHVFPIEGRAVGVNYPPMHPNCRSTTVFDDGKSLKKDGKTATQGGEDWDWLDEMFDDWAAGVIEKAAATAGTPEEAADIRKQGESMRQNANGVTAEKLAQLDRETQGKQDEEATQAIQKQRWNIEKGTPAKAEKAIKARVKRQKEIAALKAQTEAIIKRADSHPYAQEIRAAIDKAVMQTPMLVDNLKRAKAEHNAVVEAIAKSVTEQVKKNAKSSNDLQLSEKVLNGQAAAYCEFLKKTLAGDYGEAKTAADAYFQTLGISDRLDSFLQAYNEGFYQKALPPMLIIEEIKKGGAFQNGGFIRLDKNGDAWSGHKSTLQHEFGHYFDKVFLKRRYKYKPLLDSMTVEADPLGLQKAFAEDAARLGTRKRTNVPTFTLWGETFTIHDLKRSAVLQLSQDVIKLRKAVYATIHKKPAEHISDAVNNFETRKYVSQTLDAIQSLLGFSYGYGHDEDYVRPRKETYVEAIAQIYSSIVSGYNFLNDLLPNSTAIIRKQIID